MTLTIITLSGVYWTSTFFTCPSTSTCTNLLSLVHQCKSSSMFRNLITTYRKNMIPAMFSDDKAILTKHKNIKYLARVLTVINGSLVYTKKGQIKPNWNKHYVFNFKIFSPQLVEQTSRVTLSKIKFCRLSTVGDTFQEKY